MLKLYIFAVVDELTVAMPVEFLNVFLAIDQVLPFNIPEPLISIDWDSNGVESGSIEVAVVLLFTELLAIVSTITINEKYQGIQYMRLEPLPLKRYLYSILIFTYLDFLSHAMFLTLLYR